MGLLVKSMCCSSHHFLHSRSSMAYLHLTLVTQDVDVATELVFLTIAAFGLNNIEIDSSVHQLAAIGAVPAVGGVSKLLISITPSVINPTMELNYRFIGNFPDIVIAFGGSWREEIWAHQYTFADVYCNRSL